MPAYREHVATPALAVRIPYVKLPHLIILLLEGLPSLVDVLLTLENFSRVVMRLVQLVVMYLTPVEMIVNYGLFISDRKVLRRATNFLRVLLLG